MSFPKMASEKSDDIVIFLTNNDNSLKLFNWLSDKVDTILYKDKITLEYLESIHPKLIISYNYSHIVPAEVIDFMDGNIINLHISYLPWNKGASPNFWSFVDDTPKGVTIHKMSYGLDEGEIIYQEKMEFDINKETFTSTYNKLHDRITELFIENWEDIREGHYNTYKQYGKGTKHTSKELKAITEKLDFDWGMKICDFLEEYDSMYVRSTNNRKFE